MAPGRPISLVRPTTRRAEESWAGQIPLALRPCTALSATGDTGPPNYITGALVVLREPTWVRVEALSPSNVVPLAMEGDENALIPQCAQGPLGGPG